MRQLVKKVRERHEIVDEQLAELIEVSPADVWRRIEPESEDLSDIVEMAEPVAGVDGAVNSKVSAEFVELRKRCALPLRD